ncbi:hypothetical protein Bhyg_06528, partial [Pseudolycoriella hygida]
RVLHLLCVVILVAIYMITDTVAERESTESAESAEFPLAFGDPDMKFTRVLHLLCVVILVAIYMITDTVAERESAESAECMKPFKLKFPKFKIPKVKLPNLGRIAKATKFSKLKKLANFSKLRNIFKIPSGGGIGSGGFRPISSSSSNNNSIFLTIFSQIRDILKPKDDE